MTLEQIHPNPKNPRTLREGRGEWLYDSMEEFGDLSGFVFNRDGMTISGHQRWEKIKDKVSQMVVSESFDAPLPDGTVQRGYFEMKDGRRYDYSVRDWPQDKADRATIRANAENAGEWDKGMLVNDWSFYEDDELKEMGVPEYVFDVEDEEEQKFWAHEDNYEPPAEIVTDIVRGDLFDIGPHRLLCGDSTSADDVAKVMGGEKADLEILDPLFDMEYKEIATTFPGVICVFTRGGKAFRFLADLCDAGYGYHNLVNLTPANGVAEETLPANTHEIIHILRKDKYFSHSHALQFCKTDGNVRATSVMNFGRPTTGENYFKYAKPIGEISYLFAYSKENGVILDPFLGSGTTMVAAHQLHRRCFGIEIDPKYCQVTVDRMLKLDPSLEIKRNGKPYTRKVK